jgi:hypothetical protein
LPLFEIRDNLIDAAMRPIDILRFKLASAPCASTRDRPLGAHHPVSGQPFPDELTPRIGTTASQHEDLVQ